MGRPVNDLSTKEKAEICRFYTDGEPVGEIAKAFGITDGTVSKVAKISGLKPRQRRTVRALEVATFDPAKLTVEDIEGEARVRDVTLGEALGYERPRDIRKLIERLAPSLSELGLARHRVAPIASGKGRLSETTEQLLNLAQINYLITRCGLPNADHWCVHIARVFTAWQEARVQAVDLEVAVQLQDSLEAAAAAAPGLADLTEEMITRVVKEQTAHLATREQQVKIELLIGTVVRRAPLKSETKTQHLETVKRHYNNVCPCCSINEVVKDGSAVGQYDHWTDHPGKNGAHETWLICVQCNQGFQGRVIDRSDHQPEFHVYQKRRKQVLSTKQPTFL